MGEQNEHPFSERLERLERDMDEIRLALWNLDQKLTQAQAGARQPDQPVQQPGPAGRQPLQQRGRQYDEPEQRGGAIPTQPGHVTLPPQPGYATPPPQGPSIGGFPAPPKESNTRSMQFWLNKIGIVLVLLGVVFLFKYSVDQRWITPPLRVAFGVGLGAVLLAYGLFVHGRQKHFSQVLMGGGFAAFYISGFAAFSMYGLVDYPVAIIFMGAVTLAAFVLALWQDEETLSLVAAIGGLVTPFLLHKGITSATEAVVFSCIVVAGAVGVYMFRGWRILLMIAVIGGWLTMLLTYEQVLGHHGTRTAADKQGVQGGIAFCWFAFWVLPLLREWLRSRDPDFWRHHGILSEKEEPEGYGLTANVHVHLLSVSSAIIALTFSRQIWHLTNHEWGWLTLIAAAVYGIAFLALLPSSDLRQLAYTQLMVDVLLVTVALGLLLDGDVRFITFTAEVAALHLIAWRLDDRYVQLAGHALSLFMFGWLVEQLISDKVQGTVLFNAHALSQLAFIAVATGVALLIEQREIRYTYLICSYGAFLGWLLRELAHLANGQGYVTVAWGICAIALLAAGIIFNQSALRVAALATLFLVVAKLMLIDLKMVKAIWRVLLFVGFGFLFLVLSYYFQSLWKSKQPPGGIGAGGYGGAGGGDHGGTGGTTGVPGSPGDGEGTGAGTGSPGTAGGVAGMPGV